MNDIGRTKSDLLHEITQLRRRVVELERNAIDREKAAAALFNSEQRYRRLFESAKDGVILFSSDTGAIIDVNTAFLTLSGNPRDAILGKRFWEIGPLKNIDVAQVIFKETQSRGRIYYDDLPFETGDGRHISVEMACSVYALGSGNIIQCTVRDISGKKSLEEELWKAESRFRTLFREAAMGIAIVDAEGRISENNRKLEKMLGCGEQELVNRPFADFIQSEDLASDAALYNELLEKKRDSYQITVRCIKKERGVVWGLLAVSLIRDRMGLPLFSIRMIEDITDRMRIEKTIVKSRDFYLSLIDELPNPIRLADIEGRCIYFNKAWLEFTGRTVDRETGEGWTQGIHPGDAERLMKRFRGSLSARKPYTTEYRLRSRSGELRWLAEFGRPFNGIDGAFAGYISSCYDIHDRKAFEETLRSVSITDELTGLLNRRGFFAVAEQQLKVANRNKKGILLLYADLDGLKRINDSRGHPEGDEALVETAALLRDIFRESDIIGRLGGDEFAVLLIEDQGLQDEGLVVKRLKDGVAARNRRADRRYFLSISAGIQRYDPDSPGSLDELISRADAIMYQEKKLKYRTAKSSL